MPRNLEQPTERQDRGDTVLSHPAFGQMMVSRISGRRALYGSDFMHHSYISVRITKSELRHGLSRDWHMHGREIIEINMSEAQWATFVSSFGQGAGVPVTIHHLDQKSVPEFPLRDSGQHYKAEADAKLRNCLGLVDEAIAAANAAASGLPKAKAAQAAALTAHLNRLRSELGSNLPFVAQSFAEHMEERIEKAKVEVHGYIGAAIMRAGLTALQDATTPFEIAPPTSDDNPTKDTGP